MKKNSGFILLIVLALLGILSFLAVDFFFRSNQSSSLSNSFINQKYAYFAARSGIELAQIRVQKNSLSPSSQFSFSENSFFAGEDLNRDGSVSPEEEALGNNNGIEEIRSLELKDTLCPSFAVEDPNNLGQAHLIPINNKQRGYSWKNNSSEVASLHIQSLNTLIDVNGGINQSADRLLYEQRHDINIGYSAASTDHIYNRPTMHMLDSLGNYFKYITLRDDPNLVGITYNWEEDIDHIDNLQPTTEHFYFAPTESRPTPLKPNTSDPWNDHYFGLGYRIVENRPAAGFSRIEDIQPLVANWANDQSLNPKSTWKFIKPLLTTHARQVKHTKIWDQLNLPYPNSPPLRTIKLGFRDEDNSRLYLTTRAYEHFRSLININKAPEPVVAALIYSVSNIWIREENGPLAPTGSRGNTFLKRFPFVNDLRENQRLLPPPQSSYIHLFSMTESIQMAKDIISRRSSTPFTSFKELYDFLISWKKGFDHKEAPVGYMAGTQNKSHPFFSKAYGLFHDTFHFNMRERILWAILNTNGNLRHFIHDEALPSTEKSKEFSYIGLPGDPGNFSSEVLKYTLGRSGRTLGKIYFDKSYPHEFGSEITFLDGGRFNIKSLGYNLTQTGKVLASFQIAANIDLWQSTTLTHQKDFVEALNSGVITGNIHLAETNDWATYPEVLNDHGGVAPSGLTPAIWDGQIALAPRSQSLPSNFLNSTNVRLAFNPYDKSPDFHLSPTSQHSLMPFDLELPFSGVAFAPDATVDNDGDGNPDNGQYDRIPWPHDSNSSEIPSLLADFNAQEADLDLTSHLTPGGGFFPDAGASTLFSNGWSALTQKTQDVRYAGLYFPDTDSSGDKFIGNISSGAVSFLFKPHSFPLSHVAQTRNDSNYFYLWSQNAHCLFDYSFFIRDNAITTAANNDLTTIGFDPAIDTQAGLLFGNVRLLHGSMWSRPAQVHNEVDNFLNIFPLNNKRWKYDGPAGTNSRIGWTHKDDPTSFIIPAGQVYPPAAQGRHYLFSNMDGMQMPVELNGQPTLGLKGYLPNGDLNAHNHELALENHQPYVSDKLWLEFKVTIVTAAQTINDANASPSPRDYKQTFSPPLTTFAFNAPSDYRDLYESATLSISNPNNFPYYADGISSGRSTGHHTIVKSFRMDYPIVLDDSLESYGKGPTDEEGIPQSMLNSGRWHHILIAWRNMKNLLSLDDANTRGGSVAFYHNGTFKKSKSLESGATSPPSTMQYNGMFWHQDFSTSYYNPNIYNPIYTSGFSYGSGAFGANSSMDIFFPTINYSSNSGGELIYYYRPNNSSAPWARLPIQGFGMEAEGYHRPLDLYFPGSTMHFAMLDSDRDGLSGNIKHSHFNIMHKAAHKFFFGSAPAGELTVQGNLPRDENSEITSLSTHKYVTDGSFMNIEIASGVHSNLLAADGGFVPDIPNYDPFFFPSSATDEDTNTTPLNNARLYPFNADNLKDALGGKLLALNWTAYLPPFHQFWDDTDGNTEVWDDVTESYSLVTGTPGPSDADQLSLYLRVDENNTPILGLDRLHIEQAKPQERNNNVILFNPSQSIGNDPRKISLKINFSKGLQTSPANSPVYSTPLIDDLTVYYLKNSAAKIISWEQEQK